MIEKAFRSISVTMSLFSLSHFNSIGQDEKMTSQDKPNIILILADDLGYSQLGCYGGEVQTPNLDRLAQNGIRFTQMHNTSKSFPSRACLLTGVYAQQCGMSKKPLSIVNAITLGDMLKTAGYRTFLSGKNHSTTSLYKMGFDRVYEYMGASTNHFNPGPQRPGEPVGIKKDGGATTWNIDDFTTDDYVTPSDFYSTDYFTKYAISYLEEYRSEDKPFFLFLAYTAPHDPIQAWPEDIAKYRGKYKVGYQAIREARYKKMLELGMVDPNMKLSTQSSADWASLSDAEKDVEDLKMAVYAAMVDRIDQNIGKLIDKLTELGKLNNTLILFASDNGASGEFNEGIYQNPGVDQIGSMTYYAFLNENWANVCNTPYRYFKNDSYEGGICTPFIAYWPDRIKNTGTINNDLLHFVDIMPTFIETSSGTYPTQYRDQLIAPLQGKSFLTILDGTATQERLEPVFWQWKDGTAVRVGKWKAVSTILNRKVIWELFDMSVDRNETTDLKAAFPEKFIELKTLYNNWIATVGLPTTVEFQLRPSKGHLYPNPTSSYVYWSQNDDLNEVIVYNMSGMVALRIEKPEYNYVDLGNLEGGTYLVRLYKNNQIISTQKVIKR
jgi:arylsulfatase